MLRPGARSLTVTASQAAGFTALVGGPVRLIGWSLNDGIASQGNFADTSAAAPAAGVTIASLVLPNGTYQVQWFFELTGAAGAADVDNVALFIGATQIDQSVNLGAVGNYGPFNAEAVVTGGPLTLAAKAIGNATAATTYKVKLTVTPVGITTGQILDGGQVVAFTAIPQGGVDTQILSNDGIAVDNSLKVGSIVGTVQGVLWYYLKSDLECPDDPAAY